MERRSFLRWLGISLAVSMFPCGTKPAGASEEYDCVIVGGGLSGLGAAAMLPGRRVLVMEKGPAGGRIADGVWEGFHYPKGAEYMGAPEDELADLLDRLGLVMETCPPPVDGIALDGSILPGAAIFDRFRELGVLSEYERLLDELEALNKAGVEKALYKGVDALRRFDGYDGVNVDDWLRTREFPDVIRRYVDTENRGLFGAGNEALSLLFDIPELAWNFPWPNETDTDTVYSFRTGLMEMVQALEYHLGATLQSGAEVKNLVPVPGGTEVSYLQGGVEKRVTTRSVILAVRAPEAATIGVKSLPAAAVDMLRNIAYAPYATLNLFLSERVLHEVWAVSCPDDSFATLYDAVRMQVPQDYRGRAVLGVYIPPRPGDEHTDFLDQDDESFLKTTLRDLDKYFNGIEGKVLGYDLHRFTLAFPIFAPGYLEVMDGLTRQNRQGPVFLAGDYMLYPTLDGAFWSGVAAAEAVEAFLG